VQNRILRPVADVGAARAAEPLCGQVHPGASSMTRWASQAQPACHGPALTRQCRHPSPNGGSPPRHEASQTEYNRRPPIPGPWPERLLALESRPRPGPCRRQASPPSPPATSAPSSTSTERPPIQMSSGSGGRGSMVTSPRWSYLPACVTSAPTRACPTRSGTRRSRASTSACAVPPGKVASSSTPARPGAALTPPTRRRSSPAA
jgi:hypothetical protein